MWKVGLLGFFIGFNVISYIILLKKINQIDNEIGYLMNEYGIYIETLNKLNNQKDVRVFIGGKK